MKPVKADGADLVEGRVPLEADDGAGGEGHRDHHADGAADDPEAAAAEGDLGEQPLHLLEVAAQGPRDPEQRPDVEDELVTGAVEPAERCAIGQPPFGGTIWR